MSEHITARMQPADVWRKYPTLTHMAAGGSWPAIQRHRLLSTVALLDLFDIHGEQRERLISHRRAVSEPIRHPIHGTAVIRDQEPLSDRKLAACLSGISVTDWYRLLNGYVFMWAQRANLDRMLAAYSDEPRAVISIDTRSLIGRYADRVR